MILMVFIQSCTESNKTEKLIRGNKTKYWDKPYKNTSTGKYIGAYRLSKDGSAYWVKYNRQTGKRQYAIPDDVISSNRWSLLPKGNIHLNWEEYLILKINEDTMILKNNRLNRTDTLLKSKNQADEQVFPPKTDETIYL